MGRHTPPPSASSSLLLFVKSSCKFSSSLCEVRAVMSDIRLISKEFITEFISIYRSHPALWKTKSKDYVNRNLKNIGYEALINLYKQVDSNADRDVVSKKIQSLRGSFRKELKKYEQFQKSGAGLVEQYMPSLWYFDLLMFTRDQELPNDSLEIVSASYSQDDRTDDDLEPQSSHGMDDDGNSTTMDSSVQNESDLQESSGSNSAKEGGEETCNVSLVF